MASWQKKFSTLHRKTFIGVSEKIEILKRRDNQNQGTVHRVVIFRARHTSQRKSKQTIKGDMSADHRTTWMLPTRELKDAGISHINALDRIVDSKGRYWQPESTTTIELDALENMVKVECLRVDP